MSSGAAKSQTAREILDSVGSAFAGYEAELIAGVHQWNVGGNRLARTVERLERNGARVIAHGSFLQAIWPIKKEPSSSTPVRQASVERYLRDRRDDEPCSGSFSAIWTCGSYERLNSLFRPFPPLLCQSQAISVTQSFTKFGVLWADRHTIFDHPDFGVLVHLQPLEVKEELLRLLTKIDEAVTGEFLE